MPVTQRQGLTLGAKQPRSTETPAFRASFRRIFKARPYPASGSLAIVCLARLARALVLLGRQNNNYAPDARSRRRHRLREDRIPCFN